MLRANQIHAIRAAFTAAALLLTAAHAACGTVDSLRGKSGPGSAEATSVAPEDPTGRTVQIAWTSARASHCGFIFDPNQLRANYLASEARTGKTPQEMSKVEHDYDYAHDSVTRQIKDDVDYCTKDRTATIRRDLNRYLAGDFTTRR
jgi:hypothetical protein